MKLTDELKAKLEEAETMEEKKELLEEAGMELTDEELEEVAGGFVQPQYKAGLPKNETDMKEPMPKYNQMG